MPDAPTWNGSEVCPAAAARCLAEFDRLDALMSVGTMAVIVDVDGTVVFRAEVRPIDIDDYIPGVAWLRELFATSVRTGRPVIWS